MQKRLDRGGPHTKNKWPASGGRYKRCGRLIVAGAVEDLDGVGKKLGKSVE